MLYCILLSKIEFVAFVIAITVLFIYHLKSGYGVKKALFWSILLIPIIYFSLNMVTEAVTVDEPGYEVCITDVQHLKEQGKAEAVLYEYKLSQLTIGTVFMCIPKSVKDIIGANGVWKLYKIIHWFFMYLITLITVDVWRKWILVEKSEKCNRIAENTIFAILMGLPLSCFLMKVTNYDAGSTYPAVLGLSLVWGAYKKRNTHIALIGTVVTALGVMDKWTALPYWAICVVLASVVAMDGKTDKLSKCIESLKIVCLSFAIALALQLIYFGYAFIQQNGFYRKIDLGIIIFSFNHALKAVCTNDWSVNSQNVDVWYIFLLAVLIIICSLIVEVISSILKGKTNVARWLFRIDFTFSVLGICGGGIATFFIPLKIAPYFPIPEGAYQTTDSFDGWIYHFGAGNFFEHFLYKISYLWATIITNYPLVVLFLFIMAAFIELKRRNDNENFFAALLFSMMLMLLVLYAVAGLPYDAKYYSLPMLCMPCVLVYIVYESCNLSRALCGFLYCGIIVYLIEMSMFIPNMKAFSPIWLWRNEEWNTSIRKGEWYAGEVMFWGEEMAIAGNIIDSKIDSNEIKTTSIYSNYSNCWPGNNGYRLRSIYNSDIVLSKENYYVFNKFRLFRGEQPTFINEVEPFAVILYKGEIGAWIYRGDNLIDYADYFERETGNEVIVVNGD